MSKKKVESNQMIVELINSGMSVRQVADLLKKTSRPITFQRVHEIYKEAKNAPYTQESN